MRSYFIKFLTYSLTFSFICSLAHIRIYVILSSVASIVFKKNIWKKIKNYPVSKNTKCYINYSFTFLLIISKE